MRIHSFYSDLLLSLRYLFDHVLLQPDYIKSYEFNIGNRSVQLKYETQFEFPMIRINYQETRPINYRPLVFQRTSLPNSSRFPVLFNRTKELTLDLQEELFEVSVEAVINCESQLQGLEIEQTIKNVMPMGKYFQWYKFYSFLEINQEFLNSDIFDINNDEIYNLFTKHNRRTDKIEHCYSVIYEPMIRFDSAQLEMGSSEQRSFQVTCNLTIQTAIPIYIDVPDEEKPLYGKPSREYAREVILATDEIDILLLTTSSREQIPIYIPSLNATDGSFNSTFTYDSEPYVVSGHIVDEELHCTGVLRLKNDKFDVDFLVKKELGRVVSVDVSGPISGTLINPVLTDDSLIGQMQNLPRSKARINKKYFTKQFITTIEIKNYRIIKQIKYLINKDRIIVVDPNNTSINIPVYEYNISPNIPSDIKVLPVNNLYNTNLDLNKNIHQLLFNRSSISKIVLFDLNDDSIINLSSLSIEFSNLGYFEASNLAFDSNSSNYLLTISGTLDKSTGTITYDYLIDDDPSLSSSFKIVLFYFDFIFQTGPKYGARKVQRLSMSIAPDMEPICITSLGSSYSDIFGNVGVFDNRKLLRNAIVYETSIDLENEVVTFEVVMDESFNYNTLLNSNTLYWRFLYHSMIFSSEDTSSTITLTSVESGWKLNFATSLAFYKKYLWGVSIIDPLLFQLFIQY